MGSVVRWAGPEGGDDDDRRRSGRGGPRDPARAHGFERRGATHGVVDHADAVFTWDYRKGERSALEKLYEKAKPSQWNSETDLDWSLDVDPERVETEIAISDPRRLTELMLLGLDHHRD